MFTVVYGTAEKDLFDGYGSNHDTYKADGRWLTTVDSDDAEVFCSQTCATEALIGSGFTAADDEDGRKFWIHRGDVDLYADATLYADEGEGPCTACGD